MPRLRPRRPLWDRFWAKVDLSGGLDACWPWLGAKSRKRRRGDNRRGHVRVWDEARQVWSWAYAHVVALALSTDGELEKYDPVTGERLEACHRCSARWGDCMNPKHLYWGTKAQNRYDRYGRKLGAVEEPAA